MDAVDTYQEKLRSKCESTSKQIQRKWQVLILISNIINYRSGSMVINFWRYYNSNYTWYAYIDQNNWSLEELIWLHITVFILVV